MLKRPEGHATLLCRILMVIMMNHVCSLLGFRHLVVLRGELAYM
jgi:hypothetical protein